MALTWNPADKSANITLSNGDLTATTSAAARSNVRATQSVSSGKWYWEIKVDAYSGHIMQVGIGNAAASLSQSVGSDANSYGYEASNGKKAHGSETSYGAAYGLNDIIGVALDLDNGKIWWSKNGVWQNSGNPTAGTGYAFSGVSGTFFPMIGLYGNGSADTITVRFDSYDFDYSAPVGFDPLFQPIDLLDGKITISPKIDLLDGKITISPKIDLLDGKVRIKDSTTNLLDGKVQIKDSATNLFDGKVRIKDSATNLLDSRMWVVNTGQIDAACPTPTCAMSAVFRYARLQAETPTLTASFRVGKRIEAECPAPGFTCTAYVGRNPSITANVPVPTCSMRVGLSLSVEAGVPVPTCTIVANTHHLASVYGRVPCPLITCDADTENVTVISASVPCPRGVFTATIGNVADIYGRSPVPTCSMEALAGIVVSLEGRVPVPGPLVRFHASLANVSITLEGIVPVPTMISSVLCSLPSSVLRHERGEVR